MKNKLIKPGGLLLVFVCFCLYVLAQPVVAVLELSFSESMQPTRFQWYWESDAMSATQSGRKVNSNPEISFDLSNDDYQAKPGEALPTKIFVFGADDAYPKSLTTYVRLWNGASQADGGRYTDAKDFGNPGGALNSTDFTEPYEYIKNAPGIAEIYQIDEISSLTLPNTKTSKLTVYSKKAADPSGLAVQIKKCIWEIKYNDVDIDASSFTGTSVVLASPKYAFNEGDEYTFRVKYQNLWGVDGAWSPAITHSVGAAQPVDTVIESEYRLTGGGLGMNTLAIIFDTSKGAITDGAGNTIVEQGQALTFRKLIDFGDGTGGVIPISDIRSIGFWDNMSNKQVGLSNVADPIANSTIVGDAASVDAVLDMEIGGEMMPIQVSVDDIVNFTLKGYR